MFFDHRQQKRGFRFRPQRFPLEHHGSPKKRIPHDRQVRYIIYHPFLVHFSFPLTVWDLPTFDVAATTRGGEDGKEQLFVILLPSWSGLASPDHPNRIVVFSASRQTIPIESAGALFIQRRPGGIDEGWEAWPACDFQFQLEMRDPIMVPRSINVIEYLSPTDPWLAATADGGFLLKGSCREHTRKQTPLFRSRCGGCGYGARAVSGRMGLWRGEFFLEREKKGSREESSSEYRSKKAHRRKKPLIEWIPISPMPAPAIAMVQGTVPVVGSALGPAVRPRKRNPEVQYRWHCQSKDQLVTRNTS